MKLIVITKKSRIAPHILNGLKRKNINIHAVVIDKRKPLGLLKRAFKIIRKYGFTELYLSIKNKTVQKFQKEEWLEDGFYNSFTDKLIFVDNINGIESENMIKGIEPDIIILAGSGILRSDIINIARKGVYNAHPGLLPYYRGVDVIPWAVLNDDDLGVTIHKVDSGIDTGQICAQQILKIEKGDNIEKLREKANNLSGELMAEFIYKLINEPEFIKYKENLKEEGRQYFKMKRKVLKITERKLRSLAAKND